MNYNLSPYGASSMLPSPVNRMMASFASDFRDGVDINLGVGYINETTIPDAKLLEAMKAVTEHPDVYRQAFNYGGPHGSPNLIRALRRFYADRNIGALVESDFDNLDIVIGPSGATSILDALADIFAPGIVVTADPMYYIYCNQLERKGFRVVTVPEDHDGVSPEAVEACLDALGDDAQHLSFFYVVTVNNPSGTILSNTRKQALTRLAEAWSDKLDKCVPIFFDQAYEWLIHDPSADKPESAMLWNERGLAYEIGTLSKVLAPALRIGFIMGRPGMLLDAIVQKTSDVGFSAPLLNQEMAAYMLEHHIDAQLNRVKEGYRQKAGAVKEGIVRIFGDHVEECRGGQGGFYYYLTLRDVETDTQSPFFAFLSRTTGNAAVDGPPDHLLPRVIYLPGEFCVHPQGTSAQEGRRQLRLSYGFEEIPVILQALEYMKQAIEFGLTKPSH